MEDGPYKMPLHNSKLDWLIWALCLYIEIENENEIEIKILLVHNLWCGRWAKQIYELQTNEQK